MSERETLMKGIIEQIKAPQLIRRQKGVRELKKRIDAKDISSQEVQVLASKLTSLLDSDESSWQVKHGVFLAAEGLLKIHMLGNKERKSVMNAALENLEHKEYRVRLVIGSVLQALAAEDGISVYNNCKEVILKSIDKNFTRDPSMVKIENKGKFLLPVANLLDLVECEEKSKADKEVAKEEVKSDPTVSAPPSGLPATPPTGAVLPSLGGGLPGLGRIGGKALKKRLEHHLPKHNKENKPGASKAAVKKPSVTTRVSKPAELTRWKAELREQMHDTEGWKSLETSFNALKCIITGTKGAFSRFVDDNFLALLEVASMHTNRFVREITYHTTAAIAQNCDIKTLENLANRTCTLLAKGLSDNWSQVRYASSIATRNLMVRAIKAGFAEKYLGILLPPMCINRYYVAQGVRIYSHETWRMVMGERGPELVAKYIDKVVKFYVSQAKADNHAVREAACACITELALKVEKKAVSPHVTVLLDTLIECFKDDSWPVRDAACNACGDFITAFPEESKPTMKKLYVLWFDHLKDSIPTVREDAAVALGKAVSAYGEEGEKVVSAHLKKALPAVKEQQKDSKRLANMENVTQFGVARRVTGKESLANSDAQMYSCGSLAPKMKRRGAGCMDHSFQRPAEPWEVTDGAVYLLRELSDKSPNVVSSLMHTLSEMIELRHYGHHVYLKQTVWKVLPVIAKNLGKRPFKRVMEPLLPVLFDTLVCNHRLAMHAAAECIEFLDKYLGHVIFTGRLTSDMKDKLRRNNLVRIQV